MPDKTHHTHFTIGEQKWKTIEAKRARTKLMWQFFWVWLLGVSLPLVVICFMEIAK